MSLLANSAVIGGEVYTGDIKHSLRFRSAASAYLSLIFGTPTSNASWALSLFDKRGTLSTIQSIFSAGDSDLRYNATTDTISISNDASVVATSTAVFRDVTSPVHLFFRSNGTNIKGYRNTEEIISYTGTIPDFNSAILHTIGKYAGGATEYFDGYRSRICFVDGGGSLTPQDFVTFNSEINEWVTKTEAEVKAVVNAGGANSFMLEFNDATSLTTLGYDNSSKGNNWTLNNFSLSGVTNDWMLDVPGNNYATLNPLDRYPGGPITSIDGNLVANPPSGSVYVGMRSTLSMSGGKWYCEFRQISESAQCRMAVGLLTSTDSLLSYIGANATGWAYLSNGLAYTNGVTTSVPLGTYTTTDTMMLAFDADAGKLWFGKNGTWEGDPVAGTGAHYSGLAAAKYFFGASTYTTTDKVAINFGQQPFTYTPPTGFKSLCQANLPEVAIKNPKKHFDAVLATGANIKTTSESVFPSNFLEWIKDRGNANNHQLIDTVRGTSAVLQSNTMAVETTYSAPSGSSVGWVWKAGGAPVANTAGSITSQVSANVEAGFSIVTYTGTGANATVGHGLGRAPGLIIVKERTNAGRHWFVQHASMATSPQQGRLLLNDTGAYASDPTAWNNLAPTSSLFSIGTGIYTNTSAANYVAYCFAEIPGYSKIMSAVLNGSADGNYLDFGFKPAYILAKCISTTSNWFEWDNKRSPDNPMNEILYLNLANAEATSGFDVDATAFGAKVRTAVSGTWIFYAIADVAGKYSLGR